MKKLTRILAVALMAMLILGTVSVSANQYDTMLIENELLTEQETILTLPVYLTIEGADENNTIVNGLYPINGTVNAASVVADLMATYHPDRELVFAEDGSIASIDGFAAGTFGGEDGWNYIVKYYMLNENGEIELFVDVPTVSIEEYPIINSCSIVLYYGEPNAPVVNVTPTEDGKISLVQCAPIFDENNVLTSFDIAPLAGGTFTFSEVVIDEETGAISEGETYTFTADENGVLELSITFEELPNGYYYGSAGKQSDVTATVGEELITMPTVVRHTDFYIVYNEPKVDTRKKLMMMLIGLM